MAKLYKVEFEDYGWERVLMFLINYMSDLEKSNDRLKKVGSDMAEQVIDINNMVIIKVNSYIVEIKKQLKNQDLNLDEYLKY